MARVLRTGMMFLCLLAGMGAAHAADVQPIPQFYADQMYCLARVIYGEARSLPEKSQLDVAFSVMNRVKANRRYFGGNTVCGVVFYRTRRGTRQYSSVKGKLGDKWWPKNENAWFKALTLAWRVYTHRAVRTTKLQKRALYYLNPKLASDAGKKWFEANLQPIGWSEAHKHRFYAER